MEYTVVIKLADGVPAAVPVPVSISNFRPVATEYISRKRAGAPTEERLGIKVPNLIPVTYQPLGYFSPCYYLPTYIYERTLPAFDLAVYLVKFQHA